MRPVRRAHEHDEHGRRCRECRARHGTRRRRRARSGRRPVAPVAVIVVLARHGGHAPRDPGRALVGAERSRRPRAGAPVRRRGARGGRRGRARPVRRVGSAAPAVPNGRRRHRSGPRAGGAHERHERGVDAGGDDRSQMVISATPSCSPSASFEPMIDSFCTASRFSAGPVSVLRDLDERLRIALDEAGRSAPRASTAGVLVGGVDVLQERGRARLPGQPELLDGVTPQLGIGFLRGQLAQLIAPPQMNSAVDDGLRTDGSFSCW